MTNKDYAILAAKVLDDKKAVDIKIMDISEKSSFADYLIIATGNSQRQIQSLVDDVEDKLAAEGLLVKSIEGKHGTGWILMDYGDVIVNVFTSEMRDRYNIEKVWGDCSFLNLEEI